jgi:SAM-dependent methyltransferase
MRPPDAASLYDVIPYPGGAFAQTHPDTLATLGTLFGLEPAPPASCRLLDVGCGDGGNLLPMALALPAATFVGIDSSGEAIARARELARTLSVDNASFEEIAIERYEPAAGAFDYVVAHGVFSWVPEPIRERLLALCAHALDRHGVAYVSYNALPGARVPQTLRELLLMKLEGIDDPAERIAGARRLLALLSGPNQGATLLGAEAAAALERSDALLFHDTLAPVNDAVLFQEFAARAAVHGLQYLAEASLLDMQAGMLPEDLQLELLADDDLVRREQVLDYLKVRRFRQTLLCDAAIEIDRTLRREPLDRLAVSSPAQATVEDPQAPERVTFTVPGGARLTTEHAPVVTALMRAVYNWPEATPVAQLLDDDASPEAHEMLHEALLRCAAANVAQLHVHPPPLTARAGKRPQASPLARLQAREQPLVTTLRHTTIRVDDELDRRLLTLVDGTRDREALRDELGVSEERLDAGLERLARSALLQA